MDTRFALSFASTDAAEAAATRLRSEGYTVDVEWLVYATSSMTSREEVEQARARMEALADELGGSFIGNGAFRRVKPNPR